MNVAVWVALIVACNTVAGPLILNMMNQRASRRETMRVEARQDKLDAAAAEVARRAEVARIQAAEHAALLLKHQDEIAAITRTAQEAAAAARVLLVASNERLAVAAETGVAELKNGEKP